jgi:hypothetical protein
MLAALAGPGKLFFRMRIRVPLLLCLLLMGCTYAWDDSLLEANIVRPGNFKAGSGVIHSVGVLRGARTAGTGADSKGDRPDRNLYRLYVLMDSDGFQAVDIDSSRFLAGEAVELTNDGRVVRVSGTTFGARSEGDR